MAAFVAVVAVTHLGFCLQTIGMLIESMAGKSGAMHGTYQVCSHIRTADRPLCICALYSLRKKHVQTIQWDPTPFLFSGHSLHPQFPIQSKTAACTNPLLPPPSGYFRSYSAMNNGKIIHTHANANRTLLRSLSMRKTGSSTTSASSFAPRGKWATLLVRTRLDVFVRVEGCLLRVGVCYLLSCRANDLFLGCF